MSSPNFIRSSGSSTADTNESAELILDLGLIKRYLKFKLTREKKIELLSTQMRQALTHFPPSSKDRFVLSITALLICYSGA